MSVYILKTIDNILLVRIIPFGKKTLATPITQSTMDGIFIECSSIRGARVKIIGLRHLVGCSADPRCMLLHFDVEKISWLK